MSEQTNDMPPAAGRPAMPSGYGIAAGAVDVERFPWSWAEEQLTLARNYWVATTRTDGRPHAAPVWGLWLDGALYFSTDPTSLKGRNIAARPEIVMHLESGDDTVILEGAVEKVTDAAALATFVDVYEAKYGFRVDTSNANFGVYSLRPRVALTWQERAFPDSATRWRFGST